MPQHLVRCRGNAVCRSLNGEVDDELQRGSRGRRRRYFLAAVMRREQDGRLKRLHVNSMRQADASHSWQPSKSRLSLPVPAFMPIAGDHKNPGTSSSFMKTGLLGCSQLLGLLAHPNNS